MWQQLHVCGGRGAGTSPPSTSCLLLIHMHHCKPAQAKCQQCQHAHTAGEDPRFAGQRQALWGTGGMDRPGSGGRRAHPTHGCGHGHPAASGGSCKLARLVRSKHTSSKGLFAAPWVPGWVRQPLCPHPSTAAPITTTPTHTGVSPSFIP